MVVVGCFGLGFYEFWLGTGVIFYRLLDGWSLMRVTMTSAMSTSTTTTVGVVRVAVVEKSGESVLRVLSEWDLFYESVQQLHWAYPSHTLEQLGHCMRPCRQSPPC